MDEDLDPEVLAAIEASKHEAEEEDLLIKAALEESIRESIDEQKNVESSEDDPLNCDQKNNESSGPEENDSNVDPPNNSEDSSKIKENGNSEETTSNGHTSEDIGVKDDLFSNYKLPVNEEEETDRESKEKHNSDHEEEEVTDRESKEKHNSDQKPDGENNKPSSPGGGEIRLEGEPVIDEDPFKDDDNEKSDTGDPQNKCKLVKVQLSKVKCDPSALSKNGVKKEAGSESDSEDETVLSKRSRAAKSSGKRKRSDSSDSDSDSGGQKSLRPRGKSKGILYPCNFCTFNSELIGELSIHKYSCQEGQAKPSFLDMAEVIIASCPGQSGIKKEAIFERLEKDFSEFLTEDKKESLQMLSRALEGGAQKGRIRKGGKGNVAYFMVGKDKRKVIFDKWKKDKTSVGYKDVKSVKQGSQEFFKIQAQLKKLGGIMQGGSKSSKKKEESDDEICVVEEKITDKTRRRAEQRKHLIEKKREQRRRELRALAAKNAGPKTVIKVNSPQGKQLLRKIVATGSVPSSVVKSPPKKFSRLDDDEEEKGLTCPICFSSFWYPNQTEEHMKTAHSFDKGKPSPSKSKDVKPKLKNAK